MGQGFCQHKLQTRILEITRSTSTTQVQARAHHPNFKHYQKTEWFEIIPNKGGFFSKMV